MSQSSPPSVVFAAQSVAGQVRTHNEDALACRPELGLWALADGMGGHERGEVASALALQGLIDALQQGAELAAAVHAAHRAIADAAGPGAGEASMGSTLVAVRLAGDGFELAWVGDSRAYRIGAERIEQLSHDHSWVQAMVDAGQMSAEEARQHPRRNLILQCLGQGEQAPEVGLEVGLLQRVFRFGIVTQDGARGAEQRPVVPSHQRLERGGFAACDAPHELAVARLRRQYDRLGIGHGF